MVGNKNYKKASKLIAIILIIIFISGIIPNIRLVYSQSNDLIVYDYVILIDTSGSMQDGNPPIFQQVQQIAADFVTKIQDGSNLVIYSFDTTHQEVGSWMDLNSSDKQSINTKINAMKAEGQYTALWDTVCQGLDRMEMLGRTGGQHVQLLISFTDGKDNISKEESKTCIDKYEKLYNDGYVYWIFNAIGGVDVPEEVEEKSNIIGIVKSDDPQPIQVVQIQPLTLDLGNLYQSGKSDNSSSCLVFWTSDEKLNGEVITFNDPPKLNRQLPSGNAIQICAAGTECERRIEISPSTSCLNFSLVNYLSEKLLSSELGSYELSLPLKVQQIDQQNQTFLVPNTIKIEFSLDLPPTPTRTPTNTPTSPPTKTPLPTATITPPPPETSLSCGGRERLDFGKIILNRDEPVTTKHLTCDIKWKDYFKPQSFEVEIKWDENSFDNEILSSFIWLSKNGELEKILKVDDSNPSFDIIVQIPKEEWKEIDNKTVFSGNLEFLLNNTKLTGDFSTDTQSIEIDYQIQKPLPVWVYFLLGFIIIAFLSVILIPKIIDSQKPPIFPVVLVFEHLDSEMRINLRNIKSIIINKKISKLIIGQSSDCQVKLPSDIDLPNQYFALFAEKEGGKIAITLEPFINMKINELPVGAKRKIKNKDIIKIGDLGISVFLSEIT